MIGGLRIGRPKYSIVLTHGASATTATTTANLNGFLCWTYITTPAAVDSAATVTVNILDSDNNTIYTKSSLAVNTTTKDALTADNHVPLAGAVTIQVVFSAAQTTADRTTTVILLTDRG